MIKKKPFSLQFGCFFKRGALIADTDKGFPAIREMFCSFFPPPRICVKWVPFVKLVFLQQNGAFFGPKNGHFRPFRTTF